MARLSAGIAVALALAAGGLAAGCRCVSGQAETRGGLPPGRPCDCESHPLAARIRSLAAESGVTDEGPARRGGRLVVHLEAEPPHLNPIVRSDGWMRRIVGHEVFEALVRPDPWTMEIVGELAERFEVGEDGLSLRFFLRRDVKFHDGEPLTARDVEFTFGRIFDPSVTAQSLRDDLEMVRAVRAVGPYEVEMTVDRPYFLLLETIGFVPILPEHVYASGDLNTHPANRAPVGSGPFRFSRWDTGEQIVLRRFDGWWGPRPPLDEVVFRVVRDRTVAFQMARRGDIDLLPRVTGDQLEEYVADERLAGRMAPVVFETPDFAFWIYNTRRGPFTDPRVRRATTMLLDRDAIRCALERCMSRLVAQPWPRGHPAFDPEVEPLPYDPGAALELLAEAGWTDHDADGMLDRGGSSFHFTLLLPAQSTGHQQMATVVQQDLDAVGIEMDIALLDWSVFIERCRNHDFDMAVNSWSLRWENDFQGVFSTDGAQNYGLWSDPHADRILEEARGMLDAEARNAEFRRLARIIDDGQPYAFMFSPLLVSLVDRGLVGARPSLEWFQYRAMGWRAGGRP